MRVKVWIDPSISEPEAIAADLAGYFYGNALNDNCGSVMFAYHSAQDAQTADMYTAGRVILDAEPNNAQKHTVEVDVGDALSLTQLVWKVTN